MPRSCWFLLWLAVFAPAPLVAQEIIRDEELLDADRPEAWAMNYVLASTVMTAFGELPALAPGGWRLAGELGHIPTLSESQQQVGFGGEKAEDLNKSPLFGRVRIALGLPAGWVAELGYTPPLTIDGAQPNDLFALAFGRRLLAGDTWNWSARILGQHGSAHGDITCPADIAGVFDPQTNPFGCVAASDDRIDLNYYGIDSTVAWGTSDWRWHATAGVLRGEPTVQIDAPVFSVRDRSHLVTRSVLHYAALGVSYPVGAHWSLAAEVLHVPLAVRRDAQRRRENDDFSALRLQLRYQ